MPHPLNLPLHRRLSHIYPSHSLHTVRIIPPKSRNFTKTRHGEHILLTYSSILTELEKVWAVIKREETTQIDAYGYDVKIIH